MTDSGHRFARDDGVAHEIDHRMAQPHPIGRVAAGDHDGVELGGMYAPGGNG
jgi:hypothetical protein